jgi:hypothetical protein
LAFGAEATVVGSTFEPARAWAAAHGSLDAAAEWNFATLGAYIATGGRFATTDEVLSACAASLAVAAGRAFDDSAATVRKRPALDDDTDRDELSNNLLA